MKKKYDSILNYSLTPTNKFQIGGKEIFSFIDRDSDTNIDWETVESFGEEWTKFSSFTDKQIEKIGDEYFDILPDQLVNDSTIALDVGCGTGRWTKYLCRKVGFVEAMDPSKAVISASKVLNNENNIRITQGEVSNIPFDDGSFDLVFSLGVLHHIPDTAQAVMDCVKKVKDGGFFMVYLYYNLDNRGPLYKLLFWISNGFRWLISKLPSLLKKAICDIIAFTVYLPFVGIAGFLSIIGLNTLASKIPLSYYVGKSLNVIKNDALDRFGTPLEQRFSKVQIEEMLIDAGLVNITFSEQHPYWHCVGQRPH